MHQPSGQMQGQAADIAIQAEQIVYLKRMMAERIAFHTGQPVERIEADSDRDRWFTAEEAKEYGFIDQVIEPLAPHRSAATDAWRSDGSRPGAVERRARSRPTLRSSSLGTLSVPRRVAEIWRRPRSSCLTGLDGDRVKYKNSVLGFLWSMLNPALTLAVYFSSSASSCPTASRTS